jgi:hypothetical protein
VSVATMSRKRCRLCIFSTCAWPALLCASLLCKRATARSSRQTLSPRLFAASKARGVLLHTHQSNLHPSQGMLASRCIRGLHHLACQTTSARSPSTKWRLPVTCTSRTEGSSRLTRADRVPAAARKVRSLAHTPFSTSSSSCSSSRGGMQTSTLDVCHPGENTPPVTTLPVQMATESAGTAGARPLPRLAVAQMTSVGDTEANYATCAALAKVSKPVYAAHVHLCIYVLPPWPRRLLGGS